MSLKTRVRLVSTLACTLSAALTIGLVKTLGWLVGLGLVCFVLAIGVFLVIIGGDRGQP